MAGILDLIDQGAPQGAPMPAHEPGLGETFGQGLRSGGYAARGQLHKLAGTTMDALGFDGSTQNAKSKVDAAYAQAEGQDLVPLHDVNGLRSGARWAAGMAGQVAPMAGAMIGASMLSGGGAIAPLAVGTAMQAPLEIGGQLQRQEADPANRWATPGEQLATAVPVGGLRAAAMNVVPAGMASRFAGGAAKASIPQALARGAMDVPAQALAMGAGEGISQVGDNTLNPNAGYDMDKIIEAAKEGGAMGALFGGVGAAGHIAHSSIGGVKAGAGRALDAAKGLVPKNVGERAGEAMDAGAEHIGDFKDWSKGAIKDRVADVKAWGAEFMADEAAPGSFKAQVQEAIANPGDKAKQAWMFAQKLARDGAETAKAAVVEADVPSRLRALHQGMKDKGRDLMDRLTDGREVADDAELAAAGDDVGKLTEVFGKADKTALDKTVEWGKGLLDSNLSPEKAAQVKQWLGSAGEKASQMGIAGMKRGQEAVKDITAKAKAFSETAVKSVKDDVAKATKKSEDYSGARKVIGDAVMTTLGRDHPVFQSAEAINHLADGLRPYIEQVASGRALDSFDKLDTLTKLYDVLGDQTTSVLKAVHTAVSGAGKEDAALFRSLNQIDAVVKGRQGVVETMRKNLIPELQDSVKSPELQTEADMLAKWAQDKVKDPSDVEKAKFQDAQIKAALAHRYGEKADLVMKAVEANVAKEEHVIDTANTRMVEADDGTTSVQHMAQGGRLYKSPEKDKGKKGFEGPAAQRMKKAQEADPESTIEFRKSSEIGLDDPLVKKKLASLIDDAEEMGMTSEEAKAHAYKHIDDYGIIRATTPKQETKITAADVTAMRLDARYPDSAARIDAGDVKFDGIRITDVMNKKLNKPDDWLIDERPGSPERMARMFKEGVAALQAQTGHVFEIPDSTQITKGGLTWGEARKIKPTEQDKYDDGVTRRINELRAAWKKAKTPEERKAIAKEGEKLVGEKDWAVVREQAGDIRSGEDDLVDSGRTAPDPFGNVTAALKGGDDTAAVIRTNLSGNSRANDVMGKRAPAQELGGERNTERPAASTRNFADERTTLPKAHSISKDRLELERQAEVEARFAEGAPPSPKERAAKQAAFAEKARSGDDAQLKAIAESTDAKGLQRAVDYLNTKGLRDSGTAKTIEAANKRLVELVQNPDVAYGLQTKRYSLQSEVIHAALGRAGFAATHDSPTEHAGAFDWRTHAQTGEGEMVKGAGTYLSTSDQVHGYYKALFKPNEAKARANDLQYKALTEERNAITKRWLQIDMEPKSPKQDALRRELEAARDAVAAYEAAHPLRPSPTYHLSVDIKPDELLNWDRSFEKQSGLVQKAMLEAAEKFDIPSDVLSRGEDFYRVLSASFNPDRRVGDPKASDYLQSLGILGHRMRASAKDGDANPNYVIYDDSKISTNFVHFDQQAVTPGNMGPVDRKAVMDYVEKTHGQSIGVAWANILHAGEFERTATGDVIRLSVHSLNPMSTAYHESLHGFFAKLADTRQSDISAVLEKAANAAPVMNQLRKLLANEPAALAQLSNAEERAAYMYQFWAQGRLTVGTKAEGVFQRIAKFIREVTGLWTNDERAQHIMDYFHSGEFEKNRSDPNAVNKALMVSGTSHALTKLKAMTEPFREMGEALAAAGGARMRDTGIPALRELADAMKLKTTTEGTDQGYLPAARAERSRLMNKLGADLKGYTPGQMNEALEAMQTGVKAQSKPARTVQIIVQKRLAEALTYMQDAGVNVSALGMQDGVPYFPRSWDASYISAHQAEFLAMADKYKSAGVWKGDPHETMQKLMVTDGAEFNVEVDKPGMQNSKKRLLSFISHADAAPFMRKDLFQILNSYTTQATRRAEWARRFGDDGAGITSLIRSAAAQGATAAQIDAAKKFVRSVDGTLGDTINPTARRMMGNMIVYQNLRLLPLAIFSSVVDSQGIMVRGGTVGEAFSTFKRGMKEMVKNFQKDPAFDSATAMAEAIGTIDNAMLTHTLGASYSQGMVGDKGRAINDTFFRLNLMEQYNNSMRVGATEAAMGFLVRHSTKPGQHSERFLREIGLKAKDVQLDANGRPKILESDGLTLEHAAKMKAAVNRWVDGAVLRPDAVDKPIWMSDPHYALAAHLKQFVFSFHETILKRVAHEAANGNYSPAMALASYVPMMIAADYAKGMIQGGGEQPAWKDGWGPSDYVWSGMERAGLFGVGQFGIDALADVQRGGSGIGALVGPSVEQMTDAVRTLGGREQFKTFALKSMPANALYAAALKGEATDPKFVD